MKYKKTLSIRKVIKNHKELMKCLGTESKIKTKNFPGKLLLKKNWN
jgi:hypothetical protein